MPQEYLKNTHEKQKHDLKYNPVNKRTARVISARLFVSKLWWLWSPVIPSDEVRPH